jgi:hypothetical protein
MQSQPWAPAPIRQTRQLPYHFLAWYGNQYILPYHIFAFMLPFLLHIHWCKYNVEPELGPYFFRSTMNQQRLNNLMILHVH